MDLVAFEAVFIDDGGNGAAPGLDTGADYTPVAVHADIIRCAKHSGWKDNVEIDL